MLATKHSEIRESALLSSNSNPLPGHTMSVDPMHYFERNHDEYIFAAVFMDLITLLLWHYPMKSKNCTKS